MKKQIFWLVHGYRKEKKMNYAPIVIPTLNRYEHLKNCIESLQANSYAKYTDLYISLDYPPNEKYVEGYNKIKEYLSKGIEGFADVIIFYQEKNLGARGNCAFLKDLVMDKYDTFIITEDDNVFAPCYLEYINKALDLYSEDENIISVYASGPKVEGSKPEEDNVYLLKYFSAYGSGRWTKKTREMEKTVNREYIENIACSKEKLKKLKYENAVTICALASAVLRKEKVYCFADGTVPLIDMVQMIYYAAEDKYMLCSKDHMVKNMGYDGTGENCGEIKNYRFSQLQLLLDESFDILCQTRPQYKRLKVDRSIKGYFHVQGALIKLMIWRFLANRKLCK